MRPSLRSRDVKMNSIVRIYLAHSVFERQKGRKIQRRLVELGYVVVNPFYSETSREDIEKVDGGKLVPWSIKDVEEARRIINQDLEALKGCDLIVCLFPRRRTVGIMAEMTIAWKVYKIPILSVVPKDMKAHPWIMGMSERVFTSLDDLYYYLRNYHTMSGG